MRSFSSAALVAALLLSACGKQAPQAPPPKQVGVVTVQMQPVTLTTELPGRTSPFESSEVRPQVEELKEAAQGQGSSVRKRDDVHKQAQANRAFAHFRF